LRKKVRTSASEELSLPPCPKNVRTGQTPSPPDCGRLLWTAPKSSRWLQRDDLSSIPGGHVHFRQWLAYHRSALE